MAKRGIPGKVAINYTLQPLSRHSRNWTKRHDRSAHSLRWRLAGAAPLGQGLHGRDVPYMLERAHVAVVWVDATARVSLGRTKGGGRRSMSCRLTLVVLCNPTLRHRVVGNPGPAGGVGRATLALELHVGVEPSRMYLRPGVLLSTLKVVLRGTHVVWFCARRRCRAPSDQQTKDR